MKEPKGSTKPAVEQATDTKTGRPMRMDRDRYSYGSTKLLDAEGKVRSSTSNGDAIAQAMAHADTPEKLNAIAKDNGLTGKVEGGAAAFANPGQFRMTLGNMLRAKVKRGEPVTVAGVTVKKLDQRVPVAPAIKAAEDRAREREKEQERKAKEAAKASATANRVEKPAKQTAAKASTTAAQDAKAASKGKPNPTSKAAGSGGKAPSTDTDRAKQAEARVSKSRAKKPSTETEGVSSATS